MGYQRGKTTQPAGAILTVEQARRRNAQLRLELAELTREGAHLDVQVGLMRESVTASRKKLTRQIRDLDTIRIQSARLAAQVEQQTVMPEPVYGGLEGLKAATEELQAHEEKGLHSSTIRRRKGPSHGTGRMYASGCRCVECKAWRKRKSARELSNVKRRREREIADALQAHGVTEVAA